MKSPTQTVTVRVGDFLWGKVGESYMRNTKICQDTFDATNKLFDEYYATKGEQEEEQNKEILTRRMA